MRRSDSGIGGPAKPKAKVKKKKVAAKRAPSGKVSPPAAHRMQERKSRDAPPPEDLTPFPDFKREQKTYRPAGRPKPYRGGPQGGSATDTPRAGDQMAPAPSPPKPPDVKWTDSKVVRKKKSKRRGIA